MKCASMIVLSVAFSALCSGAFAQSTEPGMAGKRVVAAVDRLKAACGPDLQKHCASVSPGEGRLLFCALAHEDKISEKCDYVLYKTMNDVALLIGRIGRTAEACSNEIEKYCAQAAPGEGEIARCLRKNEATLGGSCKAAIRDLTEIGLR